MYMPMYIHIPLCIPAQIVFVSPEVLAKQEPTLVSNCSTVKILIYGIGTVKGKMQKLGG